MMRSLIGRVGLAVGVALVTQHPVQASSSELEGAAPLVRPDSPPDPDAKGEVEAESDPVSGEDELEFEAEHLDPEGSFDVFMEDGPSSGNLVSIGTMELDDEGEEPGEFELEFDSAEGGLPFSAASVADLVGRAVEVRSGATVYLVGVVPALDEKKKSDKSWEKAKESLVRPAAEPQPDAKGKVELRRKDKDGRQRFKVQAEHLAADDYHVFVEDAVGAGTFSDAGAMALDDDEDEDDEYEFEADTMDGDPLPGGVMDIADLSGRQVQVRDALDAVVLEGVIPAFLETKADEKQQKAKASLSGDDAKGKVFARSKPKQGHEELVIKGAKMLQDASVELYVEDGFAAMQLVATLPTDGDGDARYRARTKHGEALPFGAEEVSDLAGRAIEFREPGTGNVLLSGSVPEL